MRGALGRFVLEDLVYSVACEGKRLLIEGKRVERGALLFRMRRRALVGGAYSLLFTWQSIVGVAFLIVCMTHDGSVNTKTVWGLRSMRHWEPHRSPTSEAHKYSPCEAHLIKKTLYIDKDRDQREHRI